MHNVRKVKTSEDKQRERLEQSKKKATEYIQLKDLFIQTREKEDYSMEALKLTSKLLNATADSYSLWNYRKKILLSLNETCPEARAERDKEELKWLESLLPVHPKSYWIWFHRKWIMMLSLTSHPQDQINWERELTLCTKALDADQRNFHCWNYRRFVANQLKVELNEELKYTLSKINQNFSNYSAWHQRSYLLQKIYLSDPSKFIHVLNNELDLVQNAFYTSPEDQSTWFYYRWLIGMFKKHNPDHFQELVTEELQKVNELLEEEPNSKWVILTTVFLMKEIQNSDVNVIKERIVKLQNIDQQRQNYYKDLLVKQF
uniref:Geranylgeranyl transferase type-2 subunit alpha n=1 Tax=Arcella intermedia TaxID=1963864 RepID=A0A6B2LBA3_9EUKA|eukprot:TRINITY_DN27232_c0_g1_i1.p1 TRINITY_DN27232_c0_g1~~TRINITY_DN27232_c0_g1_i1.p1  ORF type:complete len:317 (+),score=72.72 TRINITY_DN27232_c0_g1_i1:58-1008(+)